VADQRTGSYADTQPQGTVLAIPPPPSIHRALSRGRNEMKRDASKRRLCMRFEKGDTFTYLDTRGRLLEKDTALGPGRSGRPPHRSRNRYNFIRPIVEDKVSAATQRVPAFEIDPATTDPEDAGAAKMSEKVAIYGYDAWRYRQAIVDVVKTAIAHGGAGYVLPYFEPNVGPYTEVDGEYIGQGDVRLKTFNGNEVYWEPGVKYHASPWWATEQAQPVDHVKNMPGYAGGELVPDASASDIPNDVKPDQQLVMVTDFYERPCPKWPRGRWLTVANGRVIVDNRKIDPTSEYPWQDYPLRDADGSVLDEPVLHRLVYTHDPDADNDLGLTWQLIDFQRSAQDCINKMVEYKNRGLNLQMLAPVRSLIDRPDDVPGTVKYYRLGPNGEKPQWEPAPDGQILNALLQIFRLIMEQMNAVSAYQDIQADPNVAAKTVGMALENARARWQSFLGDLAELHSRLMRHCLLLVARYYTEPRTLEIRGRMGWEAIPDFKGANLLHQTNVRVFPGSLEYLSRAQITAKVQFYATMGWISPQQAMTAIEGGQAEKLTEGYDLDVAKINRIINKIRDGTIMEMPTRIEMVDSMPDPVTGQTQKIPTEVPAWMPSEYDAVPVWIETLGNWMKTEDFENNPKEVQEVARLMWQGLQQLKDDQANREAARMQAQASSLGMGNAARPQTPQLPSLPNASGPGPGPSPAGSPQSVGAPAPAQPNEGGQP